ncbi:MAG TPA: DinB family protein [Anaerolineales bacterium]|nr:DinB family protein [Anaerolineales bacterium]
MELSQWFDYQLRSTLDGFIWAVQQLPIERLSVSPPVPLGEWPATQHVFHMLDYEKRLALPTMHQWLGKPGVIAPTVEGDSEHGFPGIDEMLTEFRQIRNSEINLLAKFNPADWNTIQKTTVWGEVSLYWLVCKTYQHTVEHTHDVLRLALFWDRIIKRLAHE